MDLTAVNMRNELLLRGQYVATFQQRIPIPYAMWRPWDNIGVPIHYFGPATLAIEHRRAAPIICYEQLLVAPVLLSIREKARCAARNRQRLLGRWHLHPRNPRRGNHSMVTPFWIPLVTATNR